MDSIFRGCTRPALVLGVPLVPLVLVLGPASFIAIWMTLLIGIYAWVWMIAILIPVISLLRHITTIDDQRLIQYVFLCKLLGQHRRMTAFSKRRYGPFGGASQ